MFSSALGMAAFAARAVTGPPIAVTRRLLEEVAVRALSAPEMREIAGEVIDKVDVDRLADAILEDPRTEQLVMRVMESRMIDEVTMEFVHGDLVRRVVSHLADSPEVQTAITRQTSTLADGVVQDVRRRSEHADDAIERHVRGWLRRPRHAVP